MLGFLSERKYTMSAWGYKSYENDNVMDEIPYSYQEYKNPTTKEMSKTLQKVFNPLKSYCSVYEKMETRLGTLIYFLENSEYPSIENKYLMRAMRYAQNLKNNKTYLSDWNNPKARKNRLNKEIKIINGAKNREI
jgi:hypothetical protein